MLSRLVSTTTRVKYGTSAFKRKRFCFISSLIKSGTVENNFRNSRFASLVAMSPAVSGIGNLLHAQDASTSGAIISMLENDNTFIEVSKAEAEAIITRDREDDEKLAEGIKLALDKKVLAPLAQEPCYKCIDVKGKAPADVAAEIVSSVGDAVKTGCVIVLCGLSGTGKGTTVKTLSEILPNTMCWSNGNVFRSVTMLCNTWCKQNDIEFSINVLSPENLASWMSMLHFGKYNGKYDIAIKGLGIDALVSEIANTDLKRPLVNRNIPTVAKYIQGEVVKFASDAVNVMGADGLIVLLEGRAQTVDYIDTPYRFTLTMSDSTIVGMRRCAQRVAAGALKRVGENKDDVATASAIREALAAIASGTE